MSERREPYNADFRCEHCGQLLATNDGKGGIVFEGVPVLAIVGTCPQCKTPFMLPRVEGLQVGGEGITRFIHSLRMIRENGGYGTLVARFEKCRLARVGLGEFLWDVRQG